LWPRLGTLDLRSNALGDVGANELLAAPPSPRLAALCLTNCPISEPLQAALRKRYGNHVYF
jgi:hypothetical protein